MEHIPILIIGGGIIGLSTALELVLHQNYSGENIAILEKSSFLGDQSTGRNSGVLHAGIYYPEDSFKQTLCLEGNRLWKNKYRSLFDLNINECGKFIIASSLSEKEDLDNLYQFVTKKHVPGIRPSTQKEVEKISQYTHHVASFFSGTTGVIDVADTVKKMIQFLEQKGVMISRDTEVVDVNYSTNKLIVTTPNFHIATSHLINCAGLGAVDIRKKLGLREVENYFVKGCYLKLRGKYFNESLLYPLPRKDSLGLGVHTSFDMDGAVRFGPNSIPLSEEIKENEINNQYKISDKEVEQLIQETKKTFRNIKKENLNPDYAGIRSKIKVRGEIHQDFWIKKPIENLNYIECLGIDSPGVTSAPAIAKLIAQLLFN